MPSRRETAGARHERQERRDLLRRRHAPRLEVPDASCRTPTVGSKRPPESSPEVQRRADEEVRLLVHGDGSASGIPVDFRDDARLAETRELHFDAEGFVLDGPRERLGGRAPAAVDETHDGPPAHEGEARRVEGGGVAGAQ